MCKHAKGWPCLHFFFLTTSRSFACFAGFAFLVYSWWIWQHWGSETEVTPCHIRHSVIVAQTEMSHSFWGSSITGGWEEDETGHAAPVQCLCSKAFKLHWPSRAGPPLGTVWYTVRHTFARCSVGKEGHCCFGWRSLQWKKRLGEAVVVPCCEHCVGVFEASVLGSVPAVIF